MTYCHRVQEKLIAGCIHQNVAVVAECVESGADFSKVCQFGRTPLGIAAEIGNLEVIKLLLKKKKVETEKKSETSCGSSNLGYFAMEHNQSSDYVDQVTDGSNDPSDAVPDLEWEPEINEEESVSPMEGDPWTASYFWYANILSQTGAFLGEVPHNDIDGVDEYGSTALHYAVAEGHYDTAQYLIVSGCRIDVEDDNEYTPLYIAAARNRVDIIKLLLENGANPNHMCSDEMTPLHIAASQSSLETVQTLVMAGANVNAVDATEHTPLYEAVVGSQHSVVQYLIKKGAKVNLADIHGRTPLHQAVLRGNVAIVKSLLEAGAKITQSDHLLHYAIGQNQFAMVEMLIKAGSVVNLRNQAGETPLMNAVRNADLDIIRLILQNGAMLYAANHLPYQTAMFDAFFRDANCQEVSGIMSLFEEFGWNWEMERSNLWESMFSYASVWINIHTVVTIVRRCDILSNEFLDQNRLAAATTLQKNKFILELFLKAGCKFGIMHGENSWLNSVKNQPLPLMHIARKKIRSCLRGKIYQKLRSLNIPEPLTKYLMLGDVPCSCELE